MYAIRSYYEAFTDLWGVETTLIEKEGKVLPMMLGKNISRIVTRQLEEHGVRVLLNEQVERIDQSMDAEILAVTTSSETIHCDLVVLATGVRPSSELAAAAGLSVGSNGGILVDNRLRTSDPNIYAGGDCAEYTHLVSGDKTIMPLGRITSYNVCYTKLLRPAAWYPLSW